MINFNIIVNSLEQEFERVCRSIKNIPFFIERYHDEMFPKLPQFDVINRMGKVLRSKFDENFIGIGELTIEEKENFFEEFKNEVYQELKLERNVLNIEEEFEKIILSLRQVRSSIKKYGTVSNLNIPEPYFIYMLKNKILSKIERNEKSELQGCGILTENEKNECLNLFKKYYFPEILNEVKLSTESGLRKNNIEQIFTKLNKNWGFKLYNHYDVYITYYGSGGSYHCLQDSGKILLRHSEILYRPYETTIFHEAIHMGIEDSIIQKYKLSQMEKETIVDAFCSIYIKDYKKQNIQNMEKLVSYLTLEVLEENLEDGIKKYIDS